MPRSTPVQKRKLRNGPGKLSTLAQRIATARNSRSPSPELPISNTPSLLSRLSDPAPQQAPYLEEGHLRPSEYELRKEEKRCLYCGSAEHFYRSCEHPSSAASQRKSALEEDLDVTAEARRAEVEWDPSAGNA